MTPSKLLICCDVTVIIGFSSQKSHCHTFFSILKDKFCQSHFFSLCDMQFLKLFHLWKIDISNCLVSHKFVTKQLQSNFSLFNFLHFSHFLIHFFLFEALRFVVVFFFCDVFDSLFFDCRFKGFVSNALNLLLFLRPEKKKMSEKRHFFSSIKMSYTPVSSGTQSSSRRLFDFPFLFTGLPFFFEFAEFCFCRLFFCHLFEESAIKQNSKGNEADFYIAVCSS